MSKKKKKKKEPAATAVFRPPSLKSAVAWLALIAMVIIVLCGLENVKEMLS